MCFKVKTIEAKCSKLMLEAGYPLTAEQKPKVEPKPVPRRKTNIYKRLRLSLGEAAAFLPPVGDS